MAVPQPDPLSNDIRVLPVGRFFVFSHSYHCHQPPKSLSFERSTRLVLSYCQTIIGTYRLFPLSLFSTPRH